MISQRPPIAAAWKAVVPLLSSSSVAAHAANKTVTASAWPPSEAAYKGVSPLMSALFTSAPWSRRSLITSDRPSRLAPHIAVC